MCRLLQPHIHRILGSQNTLRWKRPPRVNKSKSWDISDSWNIFPYISPLVSFVLSLTSYFHPSAHSINYFHMAIPFFICCCVTAVPSPVTPPHPSFWANTKLFSLKLHCLYDIPQPLLPSQPSACPSNLQHHPRSRTGPASPLKLAKPKLKLMTAVFWLQFGCQ